MLLRLDMKGVAVSTGSACSSGSLAPSHVLLAMSVDTADSHGSLRFSLGKSNTEEQMDYTAEAVAEVVGLLRAMSPVWADFKAQLAEEDPLSIRS